MRSCATFPLIGYVRYFLESIRPEIRQYFFESDLDGKPFSRRQRSIVYQRAKNEKETVAFGMQADPNVLGFEWAAHSVYPNQSFSEEQMLKQQRVLKRYTLIKQLKQVQNLHSQLN